MSTPDFSDELTDQLGDAATTVDPGDGDIALARVRDTASRRGQRRRAAMGIAAVSALVAGGVLVVNLASSNGDDMIVSSPAPEEQEPTSTDAIEEDEATSAPSGNADLSESAPPPADRPLPVIASRVEAVTDDGLAIDEQNSAGAQLYPWKGGFLAVHNEYPAQALPTELPPELAERFPQEVLDLFPDGLPPTLDEATEVLVEAGLYEVVSEIVLNDSEVSEVIDGEPSELTITLRFSEDGSEWSNIDSDIPVALESFPTIASTGERLAMVVPVADGPDIAGDSIGNPTALEVWSSTDLLNWELQEVALPSRPTDLPDFVQFGAYVNSIAANEDAWVVSLTTDTFVDVVSLLDDEQRARVEANNGYGSSMDETGVSVDISGDGSQPGPGEIIEFTWAELGIDEPLGEEHETLSYSAPWAGEAEQIQIGGEGQFGFTQTVALDSGFVAFGSDLRLSRDGVQWSPVQLPDGGSIDWVIETGVGLLVSGSGDQGAPFRLLFDPASSEFSPVDLAEIPETGWGRPRGRHAVVVEDYGEDFVEDQGTGFGSFGSAATVEVDGYLLELETRFTEEVNSVSYVLTDIATGVVVSTETFDPMGDGQVDFEFVKEVYDVPGDLEGFRVFDPESDDLLFEAPFSDFDFVDLDADGQPIPDSEFQLPTSDAPSEADDRAPDSWLIASVGDSLIFEQIDGSSSETHPTSVVVQGDVVLVARQNGTMIRIVVEG